MFSFHKPKVYRSTAGCCICKAKSSSSRFTDSIKYEDDLVECFKLGEKRTGEICNACVLLVKRFKKLPVGSNRHWRHVVDHRAGPGKCLGRAKSRNKKRPKLKAEARAASPGADDDISSDLSVLGVLSGPPSPTEPKTSRKRFRHPEQILNPESTHTGLVDLTYWKTKKVCCGVIFVGPGGIVIIDPRRLNPWSSNCGCRRRPAPPAAVALAVSDEDRASESSQSPRHTNEESRASPPQADIATHGSSSTCTTISDSSSDSGYDESSNPAAIATAN